MTSAIKKSADTKMAKSLENFKNTLTKIRTGRAHAGLLDHIQIDYYGAMMPLNQIATVTASDARTLNVQPFEAKMAGVIEKAIRDADMGLNPSANGSTVRVPMPALTEERRKELIKVVKTEAEDAKVAVRNIRRDANNELKAKLKDKAITEDDDKRTQDEVQKLTDKFIIEIDKMTADKEKELLKV
jgi:ribosome recycling factor